MCIRDSYKASRGTCQKEKAPSIAASCFFVVHLAHSYPNGAPLVAITGQVGTDRMHIPVVNTMMAKGIIPMDDKYSLWTIGIPQKNYVNQLFDRADLVIAIGYDIVECAPAKWGARPDMTIPLFLFHLSLKAALPCRVTKKRRFAISREASFPFDA